jgi:hypothetical protein
MLAPRRLIVKGSTGPIDPMPVFAFMSETLQILELLSLPEVWPQRSTARVQRHLR